MSNETHYLIPITQNYPAGVGGGGGLGNFIFLTTSTGFGGGFTFDFGFGGRLSFPFLNGLIFFQSFAGDGGAGGGGGSVCAKTVPAPKLNTPANNIFTADFLNNFFLIDRMIV
ncbi:hypothetical protein [Mucilaginibacter sp. UYCu711]|uniref:hypothetical protein n=1 Tax=Mucilaginibacter sp. UYCu711 TaxID=3156339 RepID=UPI003D1A1626